MNSHKIVKINSVHVKNTHMCNVFTKNKIHIQDVMSNHLCIEFKFSLKLSYYMFFTFSFKNINLYLLRFILNKLGKALISNVYFLNSSFQLL